MVQPTTKGNATRRGLSDPQAESTPSTVRKRLSEVINGARWSEEYFASSVDLDDHIADQVIKAFPAILAELPPAGYLESVPSMVRGKPKAEYADGEEVLLRAKVEYRNGARWFAINYLNDQVCVVPFGHKVIVPAAPAGLKVASIKAEVDG